MPWSLGFQAMGATAPAGPCFPDVMGSATWISLFAGVTERALTYDAGGDFYYMATAGTNSHGLLWGDHYTGDQSIEVTVTDFANTADTHFAAVECRRSDTQEFGGGLMFEIYKYIDTDDGPLYQWLINANDINGETIFFTEDPTPDFPSGWLFWTFGAGPFTMRLESDANGDYRAYINTTLISSGHVTGLYSGPTMMSMWMDWNSGVSPQFSDVCLNADGLCNNTAFTDMLTALLPEAWWPLNETAGTVAFDLTGHGHNGTFQAGARQAEHPGPCGTEAYVNAAGNGNAVVVPDHSAFSLPNDLTVVVVSAYVDATVSGGAQATMSPVVKNGEWYVSHALRNPDVAELATTNSGSPFFIPDIYYELLQTGGPQTFSANWRLHITTIPASGVPLMWVDNVSKGNVTSGPTGTRQGNTTGQILLGTASGAVVTPGPLHGRFMAHVAVFTRILDATERGDLWAAFDADGWPLA